MIAVGKEKLRTVWYLHIDKKKSQQQQQHKNHEMFNIKALYKHYHGIVDCLPKAHQLNVEMRKKKW